MYRRCCVPNCESERKDVKLHRLPVNQDRARLWLRVISTSVPQATTEFEGLTWKEVSTAHVCHKHFESKYVRRNMHLISSACPTLFTLQDMQSGRPANVHAQIESLERERLLNIDHTYVKKYHYDHNYAKDTIVSEYVNITDVEDNSNADNVNPEQQNEQPNNKKDGPDIGKLKERFEGIDIAFRRIPGGVTPCNSNPYAAGIPDCEVDDNVDDSDVPESAFQSLQGSKKDEPVFSWEKIVEVVPTDDGDAVACLGDTGALEDVPTEVSLYCDDDDVYVSSPKDADKAQSEVPDYQCNECQAVIAGLRYTCVQCCDFDLCAACEARAAHSAHYVLRVPGDRPYSEIQSVLAAIRQQILSENLFLSVIDDSLKTEIKLEPDDVPPDSSKDPMFGLNDHLPNVNDTLPDVNDLLPNVNDPLPNVNDSLLNVNDPSTELHDHFPELEDPFPDYTPLKGPDPLSGERSDSENSHTESFEESDSDYSPPRTPEESISQTDDPIPTISSDDSDTGDTNHSRRKRMRTTPYSKTYGDLIDLSHLTILQNQPAPSKDTTKIYAPQIPQKMPDNNTSSSQPQNNIKYHPTQNPANSFSTQRPALTSVHQKPVRVFSKPVPVLNQENKTENSTESETQKETRIFIPFKVPTPIYFHQKDAPESPQCSEDPIISRADAQRQIAVAIDSDSIPKAPEGSRRFVPPILKRRSPRKRKLANENPLPSLKDHNLRRTDHQRQETVVENEATENLQETVVIELLDEATENLQETEQISNEQPDICIRLPPDTNETALLQALQCPVSVRLKRDF